MQNLPRESYFLGNINKYHDSQDFVLSDDIFQDLKYLIAQYSAGIDLGSFDKNFLKLFNHNYPDTFWRLDNIDDYYLAMTLVSLFRLRTENNDLKRLAELVPFNEDRMLSFIAENSDQIDYTKPIYNLDPYVYLHNFVVDQNHTTANLDTFLEQFYFAFKGKSWYESHKSKPKQFFGYWSFGLAAIVKKYNCSDVFFIDNLFYPRDLLDKVLMPTWQDSEKGIWARGQKKSIQRLYENKLKSQTTSREHYLKSLFREKFKFNFLKINQDRLQIIFFKTFKEIAENEEKDSILSNRKQLKHALKKLGESILNIDLAKVSKEEKFFRNDIARKVYLEIMSLPEISYKNEIQFLEKLSTKDNLLSIERDTLFLFYNFAKDILTLDKTYHYDDDKFWEELDDIVKGNRLEELFRM